MKDFVKIRKAGIADAEDIAQVHVDSWRTSYRGIILDDVLDNLSYEKRTKRWTAILSEGNEKSFIYLAENEAGKVIGFVTGCEIGGVAKDKGMEGRCRAYFVRGPEYRSLSARLSMPPKPIIKDSSHDDSIPSFTSEKSWIFSPQRPR